MLTPDVAHAGVVAALPLPSVVVDAESDAALPTTAVIAVTPSRTRRRRNGRTKRSIGDILKGLRTDAKGRRCERRPCGGEVGDAADYPLITSEMLATCDASALEKLAVNEVPLDGVVPVTSASDVPEPFDTVMRYGML